MLKRIIEKLAGWVFNKMARTPFIKFHGKEAVLTREIHDDEKRVISLMNFFSRRYEKRFKKGKDSIFFEILSEWDSWASPDAQARCQEEHLRWQEEQEEIAAQIAYAGTLPCGISAYYYDCRECNCHPACRACDVPDPV